jgi:hypothetical protein
MQEEDLDSEEPKVVDQAMAAIPEEKDHGALSGADLAKEKVCPETLEQGALPFFLRVRQCLPFWKAMGASWEVQQLITEGVGRRWHNPKLSVQPSVRSLKETSAAKEILAEYRETGAVNLVPPSLYFQTRHLVPWFVLTKTEMSRGLKHRLIADCREINKHLEIRHFKLDHWQHIFPLLRKNMWGVKVDLKHAYFHLEISAPLKPFIRMLVGQELFQFQAACFGLATLPQQWMSLMKVLQKYLRAQGLLLFIYLEDILLVAQSKTLVEKQTLLLLDTLKRCGLVINHEKSQLQPSQEITHLGFVIDFHNGVLQVPPQKLKQVRKELGKLVTASALSCRKMAAILGTVRSFLAALPILRAFTDTLATFVAQSARRGWDKKLPIPESLKSQLLAVRDLLVSWKGREFQKRCRVRTLHSDSSTMGWGGVDLQSGRQVQEFWRSETGLHINIKELRAAMETVKSLAKAKDTVHLSVDNVVAYSYLRKGGGRLPHLNALCRPFLLWCMENSVKLILNLVKSEDMLADSLSRMLPDKGDYTLLRAKFLQLLAIFRPFIQPTVDMFASPGNSQLQKFVCRWPHHQAMGCNALEMDLCGITSCYSNPPWTLILPWLERLRREPHIQCLMVVPYWVGSVWWPLLVKLHKRQTPVVLVQPQWGLFTSCLGELMPPTKWPLLCLILSGSCWRENRFQLKASHCI